ncbi:MAG: hypothetical protein JOZ15_19745 [Acidobacteria bacterium]|nr:hypothetical protein [Acidobacteriota bacterium]
MIVYVSYMVTMDGLWLEDAEDIEALRLRLLEEARRLHAERVKPGHQAEDGEVTVERVESIGGVPGEPLPGP